MVRLEELREVETTDNGEPLVQIRENSKLKLLSEHKYLSPYLRRRVVKMLEQASGSLPAGLSLLVVTAHRPVSMQKELWDQRVWQMGKRNPFLFIFNRKKFERLVSKYTAPPGGSSHQCGSAVDVTLIDKSGERLDMGTSLTAFGEKCHTLSPSITTAQKANRKILYDAMTKAGFVNYELEWWHYSYGDRHWAIQNDLKECFYGPIGL